MKSFLGTAFALAMAFTGSSYAQAPFAFDFIGPPVAPGNGHQSAPGTPSVGDSDSVSQPREDLPFVGDDVAAVTDYCKAQGGGIGGLFGDPQMDVYTPIAGGSPSARIGWVFDEFNTSKIEILSWVGSWDVKCKAGFGSSLESTYAFVGADVSTPNGISDAVSGMITSDGDISIGLSWEIGGD